MMLFKLGLKNLKHNLLLNVLIIVQMIFSFLLLICIISTIVSRFKYYEPIKEFLNNKGYFYNIQYGMNPETGMTLRSTDELHDLIDGENGIAAQYDVWLEYRDGSNTNDQISDHFISYDEIYAAIYEPELAEGQWLDVYSMPQDVVPVVVSQNNYNFQVGDEISLYCNDSEIKAKIIGILKDDTKIIDSSLNSTEKIDYRNFYRNYKFEREERTAFLMLQKDLIDKDVVMQLNGNVFVTYPDDVSDETIKAGDLTMRQVRAVNGVKTEQMKENSIRFIFSQIYDLMPIFSCVFILTLVSAISSSALSAKRQLRNYAVYYICGLEWRKCTLINIFSTLISVAVSFIASTCLAVAAIKTNIINITVIELGIWQILGCLAIGLIYVILSALLPISIIGRNTPNQVIRAN